MAGSLVFLFGAGASYGATHMLPERPPLGWEVYDRLAQAYPDVWGPKTLPGWYADGLRRDFERTMFDEICLRIPSLNILEWQRSMAMFFARFTPDESSEDLFSRLLERLKESGGFSEVVIGSLNYDCILEKAAVRLGLRVEYLSDGAGEDVARVIKIHGSSNFVTENLERHKVYLTSPGSAIGCAFECINPLLAEETLKEKFAPRELRYAPVMSLYAWGKNSLVGGVKVQELRNCWRTHALYAEQLVIIGVRPNRGDTHIWETVRGTGARVYYIGGREDHRGWQEANPRLESVGETFEDGFGELMRLIE
jgi:hypothetical protein